MKKSLRNILILCLLFTSIHLSQNSKESSENYSKIKVAAHLEKVDQAWNYFLFEIEMLKSQKTSLSNIIKSKDDKIIDLESLLKSYKEYANETGPKFWQSPFFDVIFFLGGFIFAYLTMSAVKTL